MVYVYCGILVLLLIGMLVSIRYKKERFTDLNKKEHPLRFFYPLGARFVDLFEKIHPKQNPSGVQGMLKSLYVKENVEAEHYIYRTQKTATVLAILAASALLGAVLCFSGMGAEAMHQLERNDPGGGTQTYELKVDYKDTEEVIRIPIEEEEYTREEILAMLDDAAEKIKKEALGENEDAEHISKPMNFIPQYGNIDIYWEIEDPDIVGYNGSILAEPEEDETVVLNIRISLSFHDVSKSYTFPVVVITPTVTEKDLLIDGILENIEENNDIHEKEVQLPETINGDGIVFRKAADHNEALFLILGLLAVIVIIIGYDRMLENKVKKRKEQMMIDFTEIVSKLALLYEAGSSILRSWEKIVSDQEKRGESRFAYKEMKLALEKIRSGIRERDAYAQFGKRCGLHPYIKLGNILEQNLSKGAKGMRLLLKQETEDSFEERKRLARKKGEEAGTKMLAPMILMMLVVVIIIAVPALMSINL